MIRRSMMARGLIAFLAIITLVACASEEETPITVPDGATAGELFRVESCTYREEFVAECSTLVVPENRSDPNSRLIALPVIRVKSTADNPTEPIFWLAGGPGNTNMRFSHPDDLLALIKDHEFVLVGYRGVDGSVVLDCPEISQALRKPPGDLLSDESLQSYGEAGEQCAARLQSEGIDLAGYTMIETIDDMEAARKALGYERINLLSASYGTRLAMIYEWMYPDSMQRVVMAAVNTPGHFVWETETIDAQIEDYARLCAQDAGCSTRTDDLTETMRKISSDMPDRWLLMPIDEGTVKLFTFIMFNESIRPPGDPIGVYGPAAVDIWLSAAAGDASGMALASASMLRNMFLPNRFTWGHLLSMGGSTDEYLDPTRDFRSEFDSPDSILGSPMSLLIWGMGADWPTNLIPEEYLQIQPSDVETLMEAGSVDFLTPPMGSEELLPYLSKGKLVLLEEFGHGNTFWNSQAEARLHMLTTFYNSGEADASLYTYQPLDFDVGRGWPGLAKNILVIVVVVPVLLVILIGSAIYFISRRKLRHGSKHLES